MALFSPGPLVSQVSGSIGGQVFSHNRGGQYIRQRSTPTAVYTDPALEAKNRLATMSLRWGGLTTAQRLAWKTYASENPTINRIGRSTTLSGIAIHNRINSIINKAAGTLLDLPPIDAPPDALLTLTATGDIGAGTSELAFTATPLGAGHCLWVEAALVDSPGIAYVENLYKLIHVSAAALASPYDWLADATLRFGTPQVGQVLHVKVRVVDQDTGLLSGALTDVVTLTTT